MEIRGEALWFKSECGVCNTVKTMGRRAELRSKYRDIEVRKTRSAWENAECRNAEKTWLQLLCCALTVGTRCLQFQSRGVEEWGGGNVERRKCGSAGKRKRRNAEEYRVKEKIY